MRKILAVLSFASLLMGCGVAYRSGQTPDDVYFSPERNNADYVASKDQNENGRYNAANVPMEDRYLRMKSLGRSRWRMFDEDISYWNNPCWNSSSFISLYSLSGTMGLNNLSLGNPFSFNPFSYHLNPFSSMFYGNPLVVLNTTTTAPKNSGPRVYSMSNYIPPRSVFNNSKSGTAAIINTNNNSNNKYYKESNSNTGGSSRVFSIKTSGGSFAPSSQSSSGSSGAAPVRSFPRGGN